MNNGIKKAERNRQWSGIDWSKEDAFEGVDLVAAVLALRIV